MTVFCYISGHGWGHASRAIELLNTMGTLRPDLRLVARTAVSPRLFERSARVPIDLEPIETDPGVVQIDSLRLDEEESARRAAAFYGDFERRVEDEAERLRAGQASLVISDAPPLATAAAARAGVPSVVVANFTWDWIYGAYPAFPRLAPGVVALIQSAYAPAALALRLPMHGGFESMREVTRDVPFIARRSMRDRLDVRRRLGIPSSRPALLASFGAYGADLPLDDIGRWDEFTIIDEHHPAAVGLKYEDLVAAADVVVSKPGYGIISDCIANGTALLYTARGHFVEYDVMVAEMPSVLRCRFIAQDDLRAGRWSDAIDALLMQPAPSERPRIDGADVSAEAILRLLP